MYIIAAIFFGVFSIGMVACVVHLMRVRKEQAREIAKLQTKVSTLEYRCRSTRKVNRDLRRLSSLVSGQNTVLRQELHAAHQNLAMVLDNYKPLIAGNVGVEISRFGVHYTFTHAELLEPDSNFN